ncbi:MAG: radical SAM protein [Acidobacteriia bacterium]|nr:radical SAM protein [Terriglobia bacterium]
MIERIYRYFLHKFHARHWWYMDLCPSWKCNAKCPTCGAWKRPKDSLTARQAETIIKDKAFRNIKYVVIEGGEPTLWPELVWFVRTFLFHHPKAKISIITNGLLVQKAVDIARDLGGFTDRVHFVVSLNGIGPKHDESRGVPGAYDFTIRSAAIYKDAGFRVSFSFTPFKENFDEYEKVVAKGKEMGIFVGVCYPTVSAKFGESGITWTPLPKEKLDFILTESAKRYRWAWDKWAWLYFCEKAQAKKMMPCYAGEQLIHINPQGTIRPCSFYETFELGTVEEGSVVLADKDLSKDVCGQIPEVCQYAIGGVCNHCEIGISLNNELPLIFSYGIRGKKG